MLLTRRSLIRNRCFCAYSTEPPSLMGIFSQGASTSCVARDQRKMCCSALIPPPQTIIMIIILIISSITSIILLILLIINIIRVVIIIIIVIVIGQRQTMSGKLKNIYEAIDHYNYKGALKLCTALI